jgi:phage-related protein
LPKGIRAEYREIATQMEVNGPDLGMPDTRALSDGLFEIRADGREGWGRVFYCTLKGQRIVMVHSFLKKTNATPKRELETARRRVREVKNGTVQPIG